jgi:gentisate 1,2-dioxygenase
MSTTVTTDFRSLDDLYAFLRQHSARAGWEGRSPGAAHGPGAFKPGHWDYSELYPALEAAGRLVDTEFAERRNFILINPANAGHVGTSSTLVAAYQMILPDERARSHRHTANALRFILDTKPGVYTTVDGVPYPMLPNDVVLTPGWCWHGHANESGASAYWIDVLDVPLTMALDAMIFEPYPDAYEPAGNGALNPAFIYAWSATEAALAKAPPAAGGFFAREIALDAYRFPTFELSMGALDPGKATAVRKTTANNIYCVAQGTGRSTVGESTFTWGRGDIFVAPANVPHEHVSDAGAVLFRVTDAPLLRAIDWLR